MRRRITHQLTVIIALTLGISLGACGHIHTYGGIEHDYDLDLGGGHHHKHKKPKKRKHKHKRHHHHHDDAFSTISNDYTLNTICK